MRADIFGIDLEERRMKNQNKVLLSPIALAVLAVMSQASAQQAPDAAKPASSTTLDTVVVTGFRASLESALNKKREDNGMVDVIKAEDIAKFPNTNGRNCATQSLKSAQSPLPIPAQSRCKGSPLHSGRHAHAVRVRP